MFGVIERYRRNHRGQRPIDDIGGIEPSTHPHFEQEHIRAAACEQQEPGRRGDFEYGDGCARIDAFTFGERLAELFVRSEPSFALGTEAKALVEAYQMRRGIDVHPQPCRLQDGAHEGDGRALAVGASDMDRRRQLALGMAEVRENAPHPIERKIDPLRMQRGKPGDNGIDGGHEFFRRPCTQTACTGASWRRPLRRSRNHSH